MKRNRVLLSLVIFSSLIPVLCGIGQTAPITNSPGTVINPKDGAEIVLIPAGPFLMGSAETDKSAFPLERPQRTVSLDAYYIYKNDVTVAQYRKFCEATGHPMPRQPDFGWHDNDPIVNVNWPGARAYAQWAGAMLPTEAQWEKAARGTDGRRYPWGDEWDATKCQSSTKYGDAGHPVAVGSFPAGASPYGVLDMAGNVRQWCADWYDKDYYRAAPALNPTGPEDGTSRVKRGSSWIENSPRIFRTAVRASSQPDTLSPLVSFRCVMRPEQVPPPATEIPAQAPDALSKNVSKPGDPTAAPAAGLLANISTGRSSSAVAVNPDTNRVYVLNYYGETLNVIDGGTNKVMTTIPVGERPR